MVKIRFAVCPPLIEESNDSAQRSSAPPATPGWSGHCGAHIFFNVVRADGRCTAKKNTDRGTTYVQYRVQYASCGLATRLSGSSVEPGGNIQQDRR